MFRIGARRFSTTVRRAAETVSQMEGPNPYGIKVSSVQGVVKGLTGGKLTTNSAREDV
jgi:cysteine synthase A